MKVSELVLFENDDFVALNKPSGLLTIPDRAGNDPSLKGYLKQQYGDIFTVHRLDRDTSGLVVFAKNEAAHKSLSQAFESRTVEKFYLGLVLGVPAETTGTIDIGLMEHPGKRGLMVANKKGKTALTDYTVLESFRFFSWVQFQIHTGRTHQIRVHAKHMGHPVVCDPLYGDGKPVLLSTIKKKTYHLSKDEEAERPILARLALHSANLKFTLNNETFELEAPLPKDLKALLQQLRKNAV
ncbi:MAG TPA: RluA family pseudouridine synthase [Chitinophagaceae bacterium]|nr:RluA family pseudouridine synthase [Chitinophagaceae bacterium]